MGHRNPDRVPIAYRRARCETVAQMRRDHWDVISKCGTCGLIMRVDLALRTVVNGQTVQETSTSLMIFDIPTLISAVSEFAALEPGDMILTGTPSGIGFRREPPLLLGPGDVVSVEVDGVGRVENRFVAEG